MTDRADRRRKFTEAVADLSAATIAWNAAVDQFERAGDEYWGRLADDVLNREFDEFEAAMLADDPLSEEMVPPTPIRLVQRLTNLISTCTPLHSGSRNPGRGVLRK